MNFLQTQQAQIYAGIIIALTTIGAFIIISARNRRKPTKEDLWTAEGYYNYLLATIKASRDMEELAAAWFMVENSWYTKIFRVPINRIERNRKYTQLCNAYIEVEKRLTTVKVELCAN